MPRLVALEGLSGVGKTTVLEILRSRLGIPVVQTPPTYYREVAERVDSAPPLEQFLFYAAATIAAGRMATEQETSGVVLLDRYVVSLFALHGTGVDAGTIEYINRLILPASISINLEVDEQQWLRRCGEYSGSSVLKHKIINDRAYRAVIIDFFRSNCDVTIETSTLAPHGVADRIVEILR